MTDGDLVHASRTVTAMSASADQRMVEEFVAGTDVPTIAARYAVPEEYVDRVVEEATYTKPKRWDWSLNRWGNRAAYSIAAGFVVNLATGVYALGTVVAVVLFVLTTAVVVTRRS
jgi:hypothetical protein